mmetsp:Transcript_47858/g.126831  ORF Transcript_47858/g.126831 Transcript_47858/m.126831 type:complete len:490 (-) Transcript_47858:842-2311(-)
MEQPLLAEPELPVPRMMAHEDVVRLHRDFQQIADPNSPELSFSWCAGPAVKHIYTGVAFGMIMHAILYRWSVATAQCDSVDDTGIATPARFLYAVVLVQAFVQLFLEFRVFQYSSIPYIQTMQHWTFMRCRIPAKLWLSLAMCNSILQTVNQGGDSLFAGTVLRTHTSCPQKVFDCCWTASLDRSMFVHSAAKGDFGTFAVAVVMVWLIGWARYVVPLAFCLPEPSFLRRMFSLRVLTIDEVRQEISGQGVEERTRFRVACREQKITVGDPLHTLAECLGMSALTWQAILFGVAREEKIRGRLNDQDNAEQQIDNYRRRIDLLLMTTKRVLIRVFCSAFCRSGLLIQCQISVLALNRASVNKLQPFLLGKILLSLFLLAPDMQAAYAFRRSSAEVVRLCDPRHLSSQIMGAANATARAKDKAAAVNKLYEQLVSMRWWLGVAQAACAVTIVLALVKLLAATVLCPHGVWDLGSGCVDVDRCLAGSSRVP